MAACSSTPQSESRAGSNADTISDERASKLANEPRQFGIAERIDEHRVELAGKPDRKRPILVRRGLALLDEMRVDALENRGLSRARELSQHAGLEHAVRLIDGADFLGRRVGREHAALRNRLEPPLRDQPVQNLADAFAGDAENLRQTMLRQFRAGSQPTLEQRARNRGMDAVVERRAAELVPLAPVCRSVSVGRVSSLPPI